MTRGQVAYEEYVSKPFTVSILRTNVPFPAQPFNEQPEEIRKAWERAALAAAQWGNFDRQTEEVGNES